jgi:predicted MFS family arabinose efflux permease
MPDAESRSPAARQIAGVGLRFFFAIVAADMPRSLLVGIAPLVLSAFVADRGFGEKLAAWLSSAELLAAAVAAIAVAGWLTRGSRSRLAAFGLALVVVAQLASMLRVDFVPMLGLRLIAGVGAGLAGAAATASAAGSQNPERLFGAIGFVAALIGALTAGPIGMAIERFGAAGAFVAAAGLSALAFPLLGKLAVVNSGNEPSDAAASNGPRVQNTGAALMILVPLFANMLGQNAVWSFTVQIGLTTGLNIADVSWVLALTALTGLAGAALASIINTQRGRTTPLLLAILGTAISVYALVESTTPLPYILANGAWSFFFAFSMPYFIGALATLDRRGRWATIGIGLAGIGGALGPAVTGGLVEANGYSILQYIAVSTGMFSAALLTPALLRIDRGKID